MAGFQWFFFFLKFFHDVKELSSLASKNEPGSGPCLIWSVFSSLYSADSELLAHTACFQPGEQQACDFSPGAISSFSFTYVPSSVSF